MPNRTEWFASTTPSFFDLTLYPAPPPEQAEIRAEFDAGWSAENRGNYAEAEARYRSALKRASEQKITDPLCLSYWRAGLAHTLLDLDKLDDAEREARAVLELRARALPAGHPNQAHDLKTLADILSKIDKDDEADALYRKAQSIFERALGPDDPSLGRLLSESGYLALKRDRDAEAARLLERARQILENAFGPDNPELIGVLVSLGHTLTKLERFDDRRLR